MYQYLKIEKNEGIACVVIDKPASLNALATDLLDELIDCFGRINEDSEVRCVILTGSGKSFVAGADIAEMNSLSVKECHAYMFKGQSLMNMIQNLNQPVIAAVNGFALGGGCELAMACDIRIASEKALFGQPEVGLGIMAGFGGTQRLQRLVGMGMAKYLLYTTERIRGAEALRIGLVEKCVAPEALMDEAMAVAKAIAKNAPIAVAQTKRAVNYGADHDIATGIAFELESQSLLFATEDKKEGMGAFLEKRAAEFKNN